MYTIEHEYRKVILTVTVLVTQLYAKCLTIFKFFALKPAHTVLYIYNTQKHIHNMR